MTITSDYINSDGTSTKKNIDPPAQRPTEDLSIEPDEIIILAEILKNLKEHQFLSLIHI